MIGQQFKIVQFKFSKWKVVAKINRNKLPKKAQKSVGNFNDGTPTHTVMRHFENGSWLAISRPRKPRTDILDDTSF